MKKRITCRVLVCLLALMVVVSFMPQPADAASKKVSSTTYDRVIKSGNTAYCAGAYHIYKVKLTKSGKVKKVTRIVKGGPVWGKSARMIKYMTLKGKYLYYADYGVSDGSCIKLIRVNTKTKKKQDLVFTDSMFYGYAIKGDKLYCKYDEEGKAVTKVMKLNGKSKKKTSKKVSMKHWNSNNKRYSIKFTSRGGYLRASLKTPKGTYFLGKNKLYY